MAKKPKQPTEISSIRHKKDTRVNIPTEELRDFVAEEEKAQKTMLYPRDPSLDPQLVWKGKASASTSSSSAALPSTHTYRKRRSATAS